MRISVILIQAIAIVPAFVLGNTLVASAGQLSSSSQQSLFQPILIDFEDFAAGTYIAGDEWAQYGVNISVDSNRRLKGDASKALPLRLYNSNCRPKGSTDKSLPICSGGDHDLATGQAFGTQPQGNVLIIQEDNSTRKNRDDLGSPDDDARGGLLTFSFEKAVENVKLGFLDFDDNDRGEGFLRIYQEADDLEAALTFNLSDINALVNPAFQGDNSMRIFSGFNMAFKRLEVEYPGSGAITHLEFTQVAPGGSHNWVDAPDSHLW